MLSSHTILTNVLLPMAALILVLVEPGSKGFTPVRKRHSNKQHQLPKLAHQQPPLWCRQTDRQRQTDRLCEAL